MPLLWLELEELEAVIRCLATCTEEWRQRPWAPDCQMGLSKLVEVYIKERRKWWERNKPKEV